MPADLERRVHDLEELLAGWADVVTLMLAREVELRERIGLPPVQDDEDVLHVKQAAAAIRRKHRTPQPPPREESDA